MFFGGHNFRKDAHFHLSSLFRRGSYPVTSLRSIQLTPTPCDSISTSLSSSPSSSSHSSSVHQRNSHPHGLITHYEPTPELKLPVHTPQQLIDTIINFLNKNLGAVIVDQQTNSNDPSIKENIQLSMKLHLDEIDKNLVEFLELTIRYDSECETDIKLKEEDPTNNDNRDKQNSVEPLFYFKESLSLKKRQLKEKKEIMRLLSG